MDQVKFVEDSLKRYGLLKQIIIFQIFKGCLSLGPFLNTLSQSLLKPENPLVLRYWMESEKVKRRQRQLTSN